MGYLFLSVALFFGLTKGFCGKKMGNVAANITSAALLNGVRMLLCILFGFVMVWMNGDLCAMRIGAAELAVSAISGIGTSLFVVMWLLAVRKSAYMMLDVFLTLGALLPMILSLFFFGETITARQWIGFVILLAAVFLMCSYHNSIKTRLTLPGILLLIGCGLANGVTDFSQKYAVRSLQDFPVTVFNFYTYVFAAVVLLLFVAVASVRQKPKFEQENGGTYRVFAYVAVMALALMLNSYFKTHAAAHLDSAVLYPLNQGAALILSTGMAALFFGERLKPKAVAGVLLCFAGLLVMNL